ncbi:methylmalonyl Co-A mutase-associated GTPase MeaB [Mycolicibacterium austroafricanum]|uniref:Methylmalonyl Co-A mutase-associated GTPase MeaB n=1 Tax=Mycolicibacterium austroafricanum TaxID=39687 RepID=A0ABT8HA48_MYCAO|nr:methylmalonyl Co-A mutase-associated GTPase MeaB [Mycolicibacterium austroafricanum]MDN4517157.1 methylmalonyl Co-A mutase-associated GTPase MeaB [Mycolicibacterium austroafricanum]
MSSEPRATIGLSSERETARMISKVERGEIVDVTGDLALGGTVGAHVIGITGSPGSGKSTLVDVLARQIRADGRTVAILAIDPSSHLTGGAVLGDRVRMSSHSQDPGIFIRSMGTRGSTTGLARAARDAVKILEAAGYDVVIVETVGVGQVELDVLTVADTVAVVLVPGLGDTMQMNKAGIMEIGDLFVVNMADRAETSAFVRDLKQALAVGASHTHTDMPPVCCTVALTGKGVDALWSTLREFDERDQASGRRLARRAEHQSRELTRHIENRVAAMLHDAMTGSARLDELRRRVQAGQMTPRAAADDWLADLRLRLE